MPLRSLQSHDASALQAFLADFAEAGEDDIPAYFPPRDWPHPQIVSALDAWSRGEQLQSPDWVPCTTLFWVEEDTLLGVINLRHALNEFLRTFGGHIGYSVRPSARRKGHATSMLRAILPHARALGLDHVLVTCDPDNIGSLRAIEHNGGVHLSTYFHEKMQDMVCMHRIDLTP